MDAESMTFCNSANSANMATPEEPPNDQISDQMLVASPDQTCNQYATKKGHQINFELF